MDKWFKCPYCKDVVFLTAKDLRRHIDAGTQNPEEHHRYYGKGHYMLEQGSEYDYV
jgi:hypothetical protein